VEVEPIGRGGPDRSGQSRRHQLARPARRRRHLDASLADGDGSAGGIRIHGEDGALDGRRQQPRLHPKMRKGLLLDLVDGAAIGLDHLHESVRRARARQREAARRRKDDDVAAMNEHGAAGGTRPQHIAGHHHHAARGRRRPAVMNEHHASGGLADPPRRLARLRGRRGSESDDQGRGACAHSRSPRRKKRRACL
jgi:hypothetical protein